MILKDLTQLMNEYTTVMDTDDDEMVLIKEAIMSLNDVQRKIYLTYVEQGTYTGTAKLFKVSNTTIKSYIGKIKEKIMEYVFEHSR